MKYLGIAKKDPLTAFGKLLMAISLVMTAIVLGASLAHNLPVTGWAAWLIAIGAAIAFDLVWLAGLTRLPTALHVGGKLLAVTASVSLLGVVASVTALTVTGHVGIFAALPVAALFLLAVRPVLDHLTPSSTTVNTLAEQKRVEKDRKAVSKAASRLHKAQRARNADDRALTAQKTTDELLDTHRHEVAREIAVMRGKAQLVAELEAARNEYKQAADLLDSLMGSGVEPAPPDTPDHAVLDDAGSAHSALEKAPHLPQHGTGFGFARALDDTTDDNANPTPEPQAVTPVRDGSAASRTAGLQARNEAARQRRESAYEAIRREGLDVAAVANRYGVTEQTARRWIKAAHA